MAAFETHIPNPHPQGTPLMLLMVPSAAHTDDFAQTIRLIWVSDSSPFQAHDFAETSPQETHQCPAQRQN